MSSGAIVHTAVELARELGRGHRIACIAPELWNKLAWATAGGVLCGGLARYVRRTSSSSQAMNTLAKSTIWSNFLASLPFLFCLPITWKERPVQFLRHWP